MNGWRDWLFAAFLVTGSLASMAVVALCGVVIWLMSGLKGVNDEG